MKTSTFSFLLFCVAAQYGCGAGSRPSEPVRTGFTSSIIVVGDTLFTLDNKKVGIFDISNEALPERKTEITATGKNSILIHQDHLYIIGNNGSSIWDVQDASHPVEVGSDDDLRGCGQTVAEDLIGYSVLKWNRHCDSNLNQIEIIDFSNPRNPEKIAEYPLDAPTSLAKTPEFLAACGRYRGITLLDVVHPAYPHEIVQLPQEDCSDVTAGPATLILWNWDGIYQYELQNAELKEISKIPTGPLSLRDL